MIWNLFGKTASLCLTMLFIATATTVEAQDCASQPIPSVTPAIGPADVRCDTLVAIDATLTLVQSEIDQLPQSEGPEFDALSVRQTELETIRSIVSAAVTEQQVSDAVNGMPPLCEVSPTTPDTLTEFCSS